MVDFALLGDSLVFEVSGVVGSGLYVINCTLLALHKLHGYEALFLCINLVASALVLINLTKRFQPCFGDVSGILGGYQPQPSRSVRKGNGILILMGILPASLAKAGAGRGG